MKLRGITLVELIVAIGIMSIVTLGMSVLFSVAWSSQAYQIKLGQASLIASRGVNAVVKNIRQAQQGDDGSFLLQSGDDFDIVFFANIDEDESVERIHYYLSGNSFFLGVTDPDVAPPYSYPVGDTTVTTVSTNVVNTASDFIFEYYDSSGTVLTAPVTPGSVRMVQVKLLVDVDPFSSPIPVTIKSRTTMRNLVNY
jgi:type II secretory pathway pseudopilin PulG